MLMVSSSVLSALRISNSLLSFSGWSFTLLLITIKLLFTPQSHEPSPPGPFGFLANTSSAFGFKDFISVTVAASGSAPLAICSSITPIRLL
ncbi:hypothetical protein D3C73_1445450 [compost metagenome]